MILAAMQHAGIDAKLVLAGKVAPEVQEWLDGLAVADRERIIVRHGFLPDDVLDEMVAAVDVVPLALTNNGPSGIMGKALAAEVPVVTAGPQVRAREIRATGGGVAWDRKRVVEGQRGSVRVDLGGGRIIKKKNTK